jgi:hypothetical protein
VPDGDTTSTPQKYCWPAVSLSFSVSALMKIADPCASMLFASSRADEKIRSAFRSGFPRSLGKRPSLPR